MTAADIQRVSVESMVRLKEEREKVRRSGGRGRGGELLPVMTLDTSSHAPVRHQQAASGRWTRRNSAGANLYSSKSAGEFTQAATACIITLAKVGRLGSEMQSRTMLRDIIRPQGRAITKITACPLACGFGAVGYRTPARITHVAHGRVSEL